MKLKNVDNYSMYIIKIHALLGIEYRYVIVFVYKDDKKTLLGYGYADSDDFVEKIT